MATKYYADTSKVPSKAAKELKSPEQPDGRIPTVGHAKSPSSPKNGLVVLAALAAVGVAWAVAYALILDETEANPTQPEAPIAGLTIFAVFFVGAQAVERLLEPVAALLDPGEKKVGEVASKADDTVAKSGAQLADKPSASIAEVEKLKKDAQDSLDEAATVAANSLLRRKVVFWALASGVGIIASAEMKLYFLNAVGIAAPPRSLDILATGLIIGAGTKPLHDLVELIQAKAQQPKAPT